jgi:hypothetical protein
MLNKLRTRGLKANLEGFVMNKVLKVQSVHECTFSTCAVCACAFLILRVDLNNYVQDVNTAMSRLEA